MRSPSKKLLVLAAFLVAILGFSASANLARGATAGLRLGSGIPVMSNASPPAMTPPTPGDYLVTLISFGETGFGQISVSPDGSARTLLTLKNGKAFSQNGSVTAGGSLLFSDKNGRETLSGTIVFTSENGGSCAGTLRHSRAGRKSALQLTLTGTRSTPPQTAGGVTKISAGTVMINNGNLFTGGVSGATLDVGGSPLAEGTLTFAVSGTAGLNVSPNPIPGAVASGAGGTMNPGVSPGTSGTSTVLTGSATFELNTAPQSGLLNINPGSVLTTGTNVNLPTGSLGGGMTIMNGAEMNFGTAAGPLLPIRLMPGLHFSVRVSRDGREHVLTVQNSSAAAVTISNLGALIDAAIASGQTVIEVGATP